MGLFQLWKLVGQGKVQMMTHFSADPFFSLDDTFLCLTPFLFHF